MAVRGSRLGDTQRRVLRTVSLLADEGSVPLWTLKAALWGISQGYLFPGACRPRRPCLRPGHASNLNRVLRSLTARGLLAEEAVAAPPGWPEGRTRGFRVTDAGRRHLVWSGLLPEAEPPEWLNLRPLPAEASE